MSAPLKNGHLNLSTVAINTINILRGKFAL